MMNSWKDDDKYKTKPWGLHWRSHTAYITSTIGIGLFTDWFLYGLVIPVLPFLFHDRLEIPLNDVQQHVSGLLAAYAGSSLVFAPVSGYIADKSNTRQRPYLFGLLALLIATIMLYYAQTEFELVVARILQGLSGVTVWTIGLSICLETVGSNNMGTTIGSIFSFADVAMSVAPVIGGIVYRKVGYVGIFGLSMGIIILDLVMRLFVIEKKIAHRYDSSIIDPMLDDHAESEQQESDTNDETQPLLANKSGYEGAWHIPQDLPTIVKQIPLLYCLGNSARLVVALFLVLIQATIIGAFDATVPTQAESLFGFSSLEAGLLFIPIGVCNIVVGPIAGRLVDKYGARLMSTLGYGIFVPLLIFLRVVQPRQIDEPGRQSQILLFAGLLALCGIGISVTSAPPVVEAGIVMQNYNKANPSVFGNKGPYAQLYALYAMAFAAGLTFGPFLSGELRSAIGYGNMNAVLAIICAMSALLSYFYIGDAKNSAKTMCVTE